MADIRTVAVIRRTPQDVFAYVTVPGNWPQWHPSSRRVTGITDRTLQVGESCHEDYVVAGRKGSCEWTARECVPGRRWTIETSTHGGRATVSYSLQPAGEGTRFERVLSYRMPSALWELLDRFILRPRIRRESEEATRRLKARLEA
jgi:uncharacterized protein YndB with AHSA1/START domain